MEIVHVDGVLDGISLSKISQMPAGLINSLNKSELRDLTAYIMASGNPKHKNFEKPAKN